LYAALHLAIIEGHTVGVDLLLQNQANSNICDENGHTPLHHAARLDKVDCVILLIRRGAQLDIADANSQVRKFSLLPCLVKI
jgi:uncharacterized protein